MSTIFDGDSDNSDVEIKTNNDYAKNYDIWRKKEELHKLQAKYGEDVRLSDLSASSSSSEDDEDGVELTEEVEKDFFKTLSCLKKKDPRIYDENVSFFRKPKQTSVQSTEKKKKEKPVFLKDYERKLILEKGGKLSDEEEENGENGENIENKVRSNSPTYVEEQERIKNSLKSALGEIDEENAEEDGEWGGLFKSREKSKEEAAREEADYKEWLAGQKASLEDKETESELKPLKDFWNDPNLDEGERFLRDYILNKKFLDKEDEDYIPTYEEIVHDSDEDLSNDENNIEKQEEFEHKFNFRFEEPDQEFIKRYPRTIENSLRKTDDRRKIKRQETKERKQKEKEEKRKELKQLQTLKRKEIEEKIEKLKEITGNTDVAFHDEDIDGDFDPEAHDKRMQALFNEEFYQGPEEDQKPEFPDLDEELEIENWERWDGTKEDLNEPHCEDDDFNMDCDYDPSNNAKSTQEELIESTRGRRKRKRKSKFSEAVSKPKPQFDPKDKTYEKYLDEYYQLDCEDFIGDLPCRFKYRKVAPNDFGLTTEEILLAKERELNRWCSLKKIVQHRPVHIEKYDQIAFAKKGSNVELKKKILASLFTPEEEEKAGKIDKSKKEPEIDKKSQSKQVKSKKRKNKNKSDPGSLKNTPEEQKKAIEPEKSNEKLEIGEKSTSVQINSKKRKRKGKSGNIALKTTTEEQEKAVKLDKPNGEPEIAKKSESAQVKSKKKKKKKGKIENTSAIQENLIGGQNNPNQSSLEKKKKRKKKKKPQTEVKSDNNNSNSRQEQKIASKKNRKRKLSTNESNKPIPNKKKRKNEKTIDISDARLSAYGMNPKKFKNKLKYGNRNKKQKT